MTKRKILAVDDEPRSLEYLARLLKAAGFEVYIASNGAEALKALTKTSFDLVLLDVTMPRMSGPEVAVEARKLEGYKDVPILFLSGDTNPDTILSAFKSGAQDYVTKPYCEEEVLARVRCQLELRDARRRLEELVRERTVALERKNIALMEILNTLEDERERMRLEITSRIETLITPLADTIRASGGRPGAEHVELLLRHIDEIFSPFAPKLCALRSKLSPQEFEIAALIRNNSSSKEIADALHISLETVKWHRSNIRKKLGIEERSANLSDFLSEI